MTERPGGPARWHELQQRALRTYLAVAGLPAPIADHAGAAARMALALRGAVADVAARRGVALEVRIGLHGGSVVAGVIGKHKFSYDLWRDTVNTASRLESHGEPGRIQVSEACAALIRDRFRLGERGAVELKGRGAMSTWWLEGAI